jgi:hypothetical protein
MVRALVNSAGFAGMAEGHVTPLIRALDNTVVGYYADLRSKGLLSIPENTIANIPEDRLRRELLGVFELFDKALFPFARRLLDKTVNMEGIAALPMLIAAWPTAKVLYLKRDGIENVLSAEKYFQIPTAIAARNWAACGDEWDRVRPLLPEGSYLEIDHGEFTNEPNRVADLLAKHIQLGRFRRARFRAYVARHTHEWLESRVRRPPLANLNWEPERLRVFLSVAGPQMIKQGYATADEVASLLGSEELKPMEVAPPAHRVPSPEPQITLGCLTQRLVTKIMSSSASTLSFENIDSAEKNTLMGTIKLLEPMRGRRLLVNVLVFDTEGASPLATHSVELTQDAQMSILLEVPHQLQKLDVLIRMKLRGGADEDSVEAEISDLRFEPGPLAP